MEQRSIQVKGDINSSLIEGIVITYNEPSLIGGEFNERFLPDAFSASLRDDLDNIRVNLQHKRENCIALPKITDDEREMRCAFSLPSSPQGENVKALIKNGVLSGLSMEFIAVEEEYEARGNLRTISKARLLGIGIVDTPSHTSSILKFAKRYRQRQKTLSSYKTEMPNLIGYYF